MLATLRDWLVLTALRIIHALSWPVWLLCLIGVGIIVLPPIAVYSYFYWVKKALEASE